MHSAKTTRNNPIGRAIVGGVLFGGVGAIVGATSAGSRTTHNTFNALQQVDAGPMIFTNRRFLFIGQQQISAVPHEYAVYVHFESKAKSQIDLHIKHAHMRPGEFFRLSGNDVMNADAYYSGIQVIRSRRT
jgi:hypothetical protein